MPDDVIILNGDDADFELMKTKMEARRLAAKQLKKRKTKSKTAVDEPAAKTLKATEAAKTQTGATGGSGQLAKSKAAKEGKAQSVQDDPSTSETYKSLFTSSSEAKKQGAQHSGWVSFNPQYFR